MHTLHYFKTNNAYWMNNIFMSTHPTVTGYGTSIDNLPGKFFALSEGWADYIGHLFASFKYGNTIVHDWTFETGSTTVLLYNRNDNYLNHLELNPTFHNSFIPRGLFYDLTDANNPNENFDEIQGFTTNNIYQMLNANMNTIQKFRDDWENDHPNTNNALLFDEYEID